MRKCVTFLSALLVVVLTGCEDMRSSRADRRLDSVEVRFDSLESRIERLEGAMLGGTRSAEQASPDSTGSRQP